MSKKPVVLMILDGYGLNDNCEHNAVCEGKTPVMDQLMSQCPFVKGQASGLAVGLPEGQMGNSEVGHLNMGAGRVVYQELTRITKSINDGDFFNVPEFLTAVENCKKTPALHLFGLVSTGGVHSHLNHIYGLLELAKRNGLEKGICTLFQTVVIHHRNPARNLLLSWKQRWRSLAQAKWHLLWAVIMQWTVIRDGTV